MHHKVQIPALILLTLWALPSESQGIKIHMHDAGGYAADAMLYKPMGQPPFAAIVLIPDRDGITARIQESAQRLAAAGYFTVAIDPNRSMPNNVAQISDDDRWHDVQSALAFVEAQSTVQKGAIAVAGWGVGGNYALRTARESRAKALMLEDPNLTGGGADEAADVPVLLIVAGKNPLASPHRIESIKRRLHATAPGSDAKIYADADRGFDDPSDSVHFRAGDFDDLQQRRLQFLAKQLAIKP